MLEHSDGQPGNFKVYREYHEKLRRADGWYCFVYRPHGRRLHDRQGQGGSLEQSPATPLAWRWRPSRNRAGENRNQFDFLTPLLVRLVI